MSVIEEGIKLWLKFVITAVMLIVPSYLVISLLVGGEAFKATGYEATGHLITIIGNIISNVTTAFGNFLLFIFTNPITIILCILFVIYMKYFR
jgi:hypothetical protein